MTLPCPDRAPVTVAATVTRDPLLIGGSRQVTRPAEHNNADRDPAVGITGGCTCTEPMLSEDGGKVRRKHSGPAGPKCRSTCTHRNTDGRQHGTAEAPTAGAAPPRRGSNDEGDLAPTRPASFRRARVCGFRQRQAWEGR
jgi:hypothetical protein